MLTLANLPELTAPIKSLHKVVTNFSSDKNKDKAVDEAAAKVKQLLSSLTDNDDEPRRLRLRLPSDELPTRLRVQLRQLGELLVCSGSLSFYLHGNSARRNELLAFLEELLDDLPGGSPKVKETGQAGGSAAASLMDDYKPAPDDWPALRRLAQLTETIDIVDLAVIVNMDRSKLGKRIKVWEKHGLVNRPNGPRGGVSLTGKGHGIVSAAFKPAPR
jgi:hypothetical protein